MQLSRLFRSAGLPLLAVVLVLAAGWVRASAQGPTDDQLQEGAQLYSDNCAVCHGPNGEGRVGATLAKDWPSIRPDLQVETTIRNGVPGSPMPAWADENGGPLSDDQIKAIVAFILTWETGGAPVVQDRPSPTARPPIEPVPNVEGDPNHGAVLYDENCVVCHGPNGQGRIGATLAKSWPSIRPDLEVKTTISNGVEGSPMPAWSQTNGGPLTEGEINDLVAYIVALPNSGSAGSEQATPAPANPTAGVLSGPGGIVLLVVLLIVLIAGILLAQRRAGNLG